MKTRSGGSAIRTRSAKVTHPGPREGSLSAIEHYRREKARRASDPLPESEALAAAKREYLARIAEDAVKGKGGRPKKKPSAASADSDQDFEVDELDNE